MDVVRNHFIDSNKTTVIMATGIESRGVFNFNFNQFMHTNCSKVSGGLLINNGNDDVFTIVESIYALNRGPYPNVGIYSMLGDQSSVMFSNVSFTSVCDAIIITSTAVVSANLLARISFLNTIFDGHNSTALSLLLNNTSESYLVNSVFTGGLSRTIRTNDPHHVWITHYNFTDLHIIDCSFVGVINGGTALWAINTLIHMAGNNTFINNYGIYGGAVRLSRSQVVTSAGTFVNFINNLANYGDAVYIEDMLCPLFSIDGGYPYFVFRRNAEGISVRSYVYINKPKNVTSCMPSSDMYNVSFSGDTLVTTSATNVSIELAVGSKSVTPGKDIILNVSVKDYFQRLATCEGSIYYTTSEHNGVQGGCNDVLGEVVLLCPFTNLNSLTLVSTAAANYSLQLFRASENFQNLTVNLVLYCDSTVSSALTFLISRCPTLSMRFNNLTHSCECVTPSIQNKDTFLCSVTFGATCVESGYWLGWIFDGDEVVSALQPCKYPYCKQTTLSCPMTSDSKYLLIDEGVDGQCNGKRGGTLCKGCKIGYAFTYLALKCVSGCQTRDSYVILSLVVICQLIKALILIMVIGNKISSRALWEDSGSPGYSIGLGNFFGPLFYMAALGRLPFGLLPQFSSLKIVVSVFRSLCLTVLDVIGEIPLCFFPTLGPLASYSMRYLSIGIVLVVLIAVYSCAHLFPRCMKFIVASPVHIISLLLLVTYWSLCNTSIAILRYSTFYGLEDVRVQLEPDLPYFTKSHIPLALISIALLTFIIIPFVSLLLSSQFLRKLVNLSKLQPFLDEFQSCYRDNYQWYSSLYFIFWVIIAAIEGYLLATELVLILLCTIHCILQPYKNKWLNHVDTFMLLNLQIITTLLYQQTLLIKENTAITALVHILVITALLYITLAIFKFAAAGLKLRTLKELTITPVINLDGKSGLENKYSADRIDVQYVRFGI